MYIIDIYIIDIYISYMYISTYIYDICVLYMIYIYTHPLSSRQIFPTPWQEFVVSVPPDPSDVRWSDLEVRFLGAGGSFPSRMMWIQAK